MLTDTQIREAFHFHFLERPLKTADPSIYVLKDGVNLRFFFHSPRYSEDMDLDVLAGSVGTLRKNGYRIRSGFARPSDLALQRSASDRQEASGANARRSIRPASTVSIDDSGTGSHAFGRSWNGSDTTARASSVYLSSRSR